MARNYRPTAPFNVAMRLLIPTTTMVKGTAVKTFTEPDEAPIFYGSFRTFGGSESTSNDVYTIFNTATIDTWFRPDIKADCRVEICETGEVYEVKGAPEDISMRHQYLQFKVEKVGGKP